MTKDKTVTISRELLERLLSSIDAHCYGFDGDEELRAVIAQEAGPLVERQDSQARPLLPSPGVFEIAEVNMRNSRLFGTGGETPVVFDEEGAVHLNLEGWSLYAPGAEPAPVAVVTPDQLIAAIEAEQERLSAEDYLMDSGDCVNVIRETVACLDKVKELNQWPTS